MCNSFGVWPLRDRAVALVATDPHGRRGRASRDEGRNNGSTQNAMLSTPPLTCCLLSLLRPPCCAVPRCAVLCCAALCHAVLCPYSWGDQLNDFISEVIGEPTYISTNSVGGEPAAGALAVVCLPHRPSAGMSLSSLALSPHQTRIRSLPVNGQQIQQPCIDQHTPVQPSCFVAS
jgi:hypothetical protein